MAVLVASKVSRAGVNTAGAAADVAGDQWANTGAEWVEVKNGSGGSINVTLDIKATVDGAAAVDPVVAVPAGETRAIGPFPPSIYNDANDHARISYSAVAGVTTKVLKLSAS